MVDAVVPWRLPLLEGKTYLIFGLRYDEGQYGHGGAYEMDDGRRLRKMASRPTNPRTQDRFGAAPEPVSTDEFELWGADGTFGLLEDEVRRQATEKRTMPPR